MWRLKCALRSQKKNAYQIKCFLCSPPKCFGFNFGELSTLRPTVPRTLQQHVENCTSLESVFYSLFPWANLVRPDKVLRSFRLWETPKFLQWKRPSIARKCVFHASIAYFYLFSKVWKQSMPMWVNGKVHDPVSCSNLNKCSGSVRDPAAGVWLPYRPGLMVSRLRELLHSWAGRPEDLR